MNKPIKIAGMSLKEGPVAYQSEDGLLDEERRRQKKNLTLAELNHVFKLYLANKRIEIKDTSILIQFSVIFNDPRFAVWHTLDKTQQSNALSEIVVLPEFSHALIKKIGEAAGDAQIIGGVIKDAYQNAIDSFSHAAFIQQRYVDRFPGIKIILLLHQVEERMLLVVIDNGFGKKVAKPKKSYTGHDYSNDFVSRLVDWLVRKYVEKEEGHLERRIAYTGGQGMALKKIMIELQLDADLHFFTNGAVFELKLKNFF